MAGLLILVMWDEPLTGTHSEPIAFKYRRRDSTGAATVAKTGTGLLEATRLHLGEFVLPVKSIIGLQVDADVFLLSALDDDGQLQRLSIEVYGTDTKQLAQAINAIRTRLSAAREKERLISMGKVDSYRDAHCPYCKATILLLELPETPQVYCDNCYTLFSRVRNGFEDVEQHFRICESCQMYSRPRQFAVFYFYFLVFTFGFHHDVTVRCSACMRSSAWKMVFGNLFGLFGFPFALIQLHRAYSTKRLSGNLEGLDGANLLARRGQIDKALEKYDQIMDRVPDNAGVKFNIATGLMLKQDFEHAEKMFEWSLDDCANYWPSLHGLQACLQRQGKSRELAAVGQVWGLVLQRLASSSNVIDDLD